MISLLMMEKSPVIFLLLKKHFEDKDARLPLWAFMHMYLYNNFYVLIRLELIPTQCYATFLHITSLWYKQHN